MLKVFHPSFENEFKMAQGHFVGDQLQATSDEGEVLFSWNLDEIELQRAGSSRDLYLLKNRNSPEHAVYTRDSSVLSKLNSNFANPSSKSHWLKQWELWAVSSSALVVIFLMTLLVLKKDTWTHYWAEQIPLSWEQKLGDFLANQMIGVKAGAYFEQSKELTILLQPLIKKAKAEGHKIQIYVIADPSINAFAIPGGHIAFHTGLLKSAKNLEMIYGVAAHEMAHVIRRHSLRAVMGGMGVFALVQLFFGDITGVAAVLLDNSQFLLTQMHSRSAEKEADQVALSLLRNLNLSSRGLVDFFQILEEKKSTQTEKLETALQFLSTHPATEDRIQELKGHVDSNPSWLDTDVQKNKDWEKLKASLP